MLCAILHWDNIFISFLQRFTARYLPLVSEDTWTLENAGTIETLWKDLLFLVVHRIVVLGEIMNLFGKYPKKGTYIVHGF